MVIRSNIQGTFSDFSNKHNNDIFIRQKSNMDPSSGTLLITLLRFVYIA